MASQVHKKKVVHLFFMRRGGVFNFFFFLAMLYFDFCILLACEIYNPNVSSQCVYWCFALNTFFSSGSLQYCKTVVYFQLKSLETPPKQTKTGNPIHHKNTVLKREESNLRFFYFLPTPPPPPQSTLCLWLFLRRRINGERKYA